MFDILAVSGIRKKMELSKAWMRTFFTSRVNELEDIPFVLSMPQERETEDDAVRARHHDHARPQVLVLRLLPFTTVLLVVSAGALAVCLILAQLALDRELRTEPAPGLKLSCR